MCPILPNWDGEMFLFVVVALFLFCFVALFLFHISIYSVFSKTLTRKPGTSPSGTGTTSGGAVGGGAQEQKKLQRQKSLSRLLGNRSKGVSKKDTVSLFVLLFVCLILL
jgi:hypothetical protein